MVDKILDEAVKEDRSVKLLIERYSDLLSQGKKTGGLRKQILDKDPDNRSGAHLRVAMLDFQCESSVGPLLRYLEKFGDRNDEDLWRVYLIVSQFFLTQEKSEEALKHAVSSLSHAPESKKLEVSFLIDSIKLK